MIKKILLIVFMVTSLLTAQDMTIGNITSKSGIITTSDLLTVRITKQSLADTGEWTAPTGIAGMGYVMIGDNVEWAQFDFKADGTVHLQFNSANVGTTNGTDNKLNIYDAGSGIIVENQLGSTLNTMIILNYITP